ncbi:MAG: DUF882 domain-containing protein [Nitrospinae bacterium]|nr:DUF882 domain-containing protein [Nitrospinota bacterium]
MKPLLEVGRVEHTQKLNRRSFLKLGALTLGVGGLAYPALAAGRKMRAPERSLAFYNTHTGESLRAVYWFRGTYLPDPLRAINHILRDHRSDESISIDVQLLDLLQAIEKELEAGQPFHIISGYRSPATNAYLHQWSDGVVAHSLHIEGKAIDIRMPGRDLVLVRRVAMSLRGGGVGYYPESNFVHVDVGRVRYW